MKKIMLFLIVGIFMLSLVSADGINLRRPLQDTWTQEELPNDPHDTDVTLFSLGAPGVDRNIVIQFNISDVNGTAENSNLSLFLNDFLSNEQLFVFYASNQSWNATAITFNTENLLGIEGSQGNFSFVNSTAAWVTFNITDILQTALDNQDKNFTIYINTTGGTAGNYNQYDSVDSATPARRPYLNLSFTPVNITLISPSEGETVLVPEVNFTLDANNIDVENVTLFVDGLLNQTNTSGLDGFYNFTTNLDIGDHNWSVTIVDTSDKIHLSGVIDFSVSKVVVNNITFQSETVEGIIETFEINVSTTVSVTAITLIWNETVNIAVIDNSVTAYTLGTIDFLIPGVGADTNITFFWNITLSDGDTISSSPTDNQTVLDVGLDNCSSFTNQILNLTVVDEELQTLLANTTIEIAVDLLSANRGEIVTSFSGLFEDENPLGICLSQSITGAQAYNIDSIIRYTATGYANEYFNLFNLSLDNNSVIENITLFSLNETDSTEFQLTFNGVDFLPVENALVFVNRQYIAENTFKTVELPKTDSNGQTVLHLVRNEVIYNILILKDGIVLGTFNNLNAFCEDFTIGSCTISLNAFSNDTGIFLYDDEVGILYDAPPTFNSTTNEVSFSFVSTDGTSKVVLLEVERRDIFGNQSLCSNTVVSSSGTVSCNIGLNLSDTEIVATISINGRKWITSTVNIDSTGFGQIGFVAWFILTMMLLLMAGDSRNGIMIAVLVSYMGAASLGIAIGGVSGIGSAGIWVIVITVAAIWKINKNRAT